MIFLLFSRRCPEIVAADRGVFDLPRGHPVESTASVHRIARTGRVVSTTDSTYIRCTDAVASGGLATAETGSTASIVCMGNTGYRRSGIVAWEATPVGLKIATQRWKRTPKQRYALRPTGVAASHGAATAPGQVGSLATGKGRDGR